MSSDGVRSMVRAGGVEELRRDGVKVVRHDGAAIAVFADDDRFFAVDNRCPHMGFPLDRGTIKDGLLTCHWHQARFDLCSGCTFDLWADDTPAYDTDVRDGVVYVATTPRHAHDLEYHLRRLRSGLEHNIALVQAKSLLGLTSAGYPWIQIFRDLADHAATESDRWSSGMEILAIVARLFPSLSEETRYFALSRAAREIASFASGASPRRSAAPLDGDHRPAPPSR